MAGLKRDKVSCPETNNGKLQIVIIRRTGYIIENNWHENLKQWNCPPGLWILNSTAMFYVLSTFEWQLNCITIQFKFLSFTYVHCMNEDDNH